jgi:hypothetical protein
VEAILREVSPPAAPPVAEPEAAEQEPSAPVEPEFPRK